MLNSKNSTLAEVGWHDQRSEYVRQEASIVNLNSQTVTLSTAQIIPLKQQCTITICGGGAVLFAGQAITQFLCDYELARHTSCQWCHRVEHDVLDLFAELGLYNRRQGKRKEVAIDAPARPEMTSRLEELPISVIDLSISGCCIRSPVAVAVGNRLMVHLVNKKNAGAKPANDAVYVRVKWQQQTGDHFLLGCEFTRRSCYEKLANYAATSKDVGHSPENSGSSLKQAFLGLGQLSASLIHKALHRSC